MKLTLLFSIKCFLIGNVNKGALRYSFRFILLFKTRVFNSNTNFHHGQVKLGAVFLHEQQNNDKSNFYVAF